MCKVLIEGDDGLHAKYGSLVAGSDGEADDPLKAAAVAFAASVAAADSKHVLDHASIEEHSAGFETFASAALGHEWHELECAGLPRDLGTGNIDFASIFDAFFAMGWQDYVTFESFSSAIVDGDLSLKTGIWPDLWTDNVVLARHARAFITPGLETAKLKAELTQKAHLP